MTKLDAVVFDWRGTLVTTVSVAAWTGEALGLLGRERDADSVAHVLTAISYADGEPSRLEADDVAETLRWVAAQGCEVAILSDIHFDLRPAFVAADLDRYVDEYVLSFECGVQKPDPAIFRAALDALGSRPERTLMVGDRASHDGAAVELGMPTLLVPPLTHPAQRRLDLVRNLVCR
ncbi:HAD family hydrolase [Mycobacterium sp. AT1]|uniref:HAD family hydrolase n=1 Tax=Mycobacterium sp. AT1 TaxID=1961706 RepID=UPI0009D5075B|nr:HAD-IA family hydrolase [Mycobacterium sp. AT1]OPX07286.1 hypothetical protein B1790_24205 [Mycobacterium sp. AT1]